ncbi:uncharacterized protein LOC120434099 [Oreochromis aureus]|uniref:uncharacterized protein LOC120434099 n=1 Tax=Oreochromis aureus TaxID=47969 RepID=UPI0019549E93|nr:uncharacterized protein LOC120434099 [Oreochromis aureus]
MFAVTSARLCWTLLSVSLVGFTCAGSFVVNVTQTSCQAEENHNITLEWTFTVETGRSPTYLIIYCDLITDDKLSVLYHVRDGAEVSESQDERFSGRVQGDKDALREGRIRLQLCRLRTEDSGRYRCEVNTDYGFSSASCRLNVTAYTLDPGGQYFLPFEIGLLTGELFEICSQAFELGHPHLFIRYVDQFNIMIRLTYPSEYRCVKQGWVDVQQCDEDGHSGAPTQGELWWHRRMDSDAERKLGRDVMGPVEGQEAPPHLP